MAARTMCFDEWFHMNRRGSLRASGKCSASTANAVMNNTTNGVSSSLTLTFARFTLCLLNLMCDVVILWVMNTVREIGGNTKQLFNSHFSVNVVHSCNNFCSLSMKMVYIYEGIQRIDGFPLMLLTQTANVALSAISIHTLCAIIVNLGYTLSLEGLSSNVLTRGKTIGLILIIWTGNGVCLLTPGYFLQENIYPLGTSRWSMGSLVAYWVSVTFVFAVAPGFVTLVFSLVMRRYFKSSNTLTSSCVNNKKQIVKFISKYTAMHTAIEFMKIVGYAAKFAEPFGGFYEDVIVVANELFLLGRIFIYVLMYKPFKLRLLQFVLCRRSNVVRIQPACVTFVDSKR